MTQEAKQRALDAKNIRFEQALFSLVQWANIGIKTAKRGQTIPCLDDCERAIRECLSQPATPEWQTIETAPKDGKRFLATDGYDVEKIRWHNGVWVIRRCPDPFFDEEWHENTPTHWMPLPDARVQEEK